MTVVHLKCSDEQIEKGSNLFLECEKSMGSLDVLYSSPQPEKCCWTEGNKNKPQWVRIKPVSTDQLAKALIPQGTLLNGF